jgi:alpha(1,3/1,4) fucosyltransferase
MKINLKVNFENFWPDFQKKDNYWYHLLSTKYNVNIADDPDLLIFSYDYTGKRLDKTYDPKKTTKVYYTGESDAPNFADCHGAITQRYISHDSHFRLPLWTQYINWFGTRPLVSNRDQCYLIDPNYLLQKKFDPDSLLKQKTNFCNFLYTQPRGLRLTFMDYFKDYKKIDSAGQLHNNMGGTVQGRSDHIFKILWQESYKFTASLENTQEPGYTTEKLLHPMSTLSLPIYWGNEKVSEEFNTSSFISIHDFESVEAAVEYIKEVDNNQDLYLDIMSRPWFKNREFPEHVKPSAVLEFLEETLEKGR